MLCKDEWTFHIKHLFYVIFRIKHFVITNLERLENVKK